MSRRLLLAPSAWNRLGSPRLSRARANELTEAVAHGELLVSLPFLLGAGYSARNAAEHTVMIDSLLDLPRLVIDRHVEDRALRLQRDLAATGEHRIPPTDLLTAVLADQNAVGVLHYDRHFDSLAERSDLDFQSVWISRAGSL